MGADQASRYEDASEIRTDGTLVVKAFNPRVDADLAQFTNRMASTVTHELSGVVRPLLKETLEAWTETASASGVNWSDMSVSQFDSAWREANKLLHGAVDKGYGLAAPGIRQKINLEIVDLHDENQKYLKNVHLPRIQESFSQVDEQVLGNIADQSGWWIRDSSGKISDAVTKKGRSIVQRGVGEGLGRDEIAKRLIKELPDMWQKYGFNYARTVAANSVSRARSYSEVSSYASAGITYLEVMAMLDERTTDQCRAMDGTIIEVSTALDHQIAASNVPTPEDISKVSPFLVPRTNKNTGDRELFIQGTTKKFATIGRSGVGNLDDRGSFSKQMSTSKLNRSGVTMPPYHHQCRTMTVPRQEMIQVPADYEAHTDSTPSTNDNPPPKKHKPSAPKPRQQQRPVTTAPKPTPRKPSTSGQKIPIDTPTRKPVGSPTKKKRQTPKKKYPETLGAYNARTKEQLQAANKGKAVKITDVKLDPKTGQLEYGYTAAGKPGRMFVRTDPGQRKGLEAKLKRASRRRAQKVPASPKPSKHSVKNMQRPTSSAREQRKQNTAARRWNSKSNLRPGGPVDSIAKRLEGNKDFEKMRKNLRAGAPDTFISKQMELWEASGRDEDKFMHYLQLATEEEFGLPPECSKMLKKDIVARLKRGKNYRENILGYRAYVRAQYDETQEFLKGKGVKHIDMLRGSGTRSRERGPKGALFDGKRRDGTITTSPLSSYTTDRDLADSFAHGSDDLNILTRQRVPRERILSLYNTGMGTDFETEFVVIGGKDDFAEHLTWSEGNGYLSSKTTLGRLFEGK
jgi:SPP1 gp7 family putative phage head morphogenesis protein